MLALLLVATGAKAGSIYQLGKSLTLEEAVKAKNVALAFKADESSELKVIYYDISKRFTMTDNSEDPTKGTKTHFALGDASSVFANINAQYRFKITGDMSYDNATAYSIQFVDDSKYFVVNWYGEDKANNKDGRAFTITAKEGTANGYTLTCYRTDEESKPSRAVTFAANGGTNSWQTAGIVYFYEIKDVYDQVNVVPTKSSIDLTTMSELWNFGKGTVTVDPTNAKVTTATAEVDGKTEGVNTGVGFDYLEFNVADYDKLVVKVTAQQKDFFVRVDQTGVDGCYQAEITSIDGSEQTITIDLSNGFATNQDDNGSHNTITAINRIYIWTSAIGEASFKEVYLEKSAKPDYLVRQNTTSNNYGTICLPFAASKPTNAYVYSVKGVDNQTTPTKLYVEEVSELAAGTAYIFQSTDANDVTFTKTGTADNLTAITTQPTSGLVGTFTADTDVPADSYILSGGKWLKSNSSKVNAYRAYLTGVSSLAVVDGTSGAKAMSLDFSATTGINSVQEAQQNGSAIYSISGVRVSKPTKGIYVRNGKKFVVK